MFEVDKNSFNSVIDWLQRATDQSSHDIVICLLANKIDMPDRIVKSSEAKELADKHGLLYWEVSAKSGQGVQEFFREMAIRLPGSSVESNRIISPPVQDPVVLESESKNAHSKKKCC